MKNSAVVSAEAKLVGAALGRRGIDVAKCVETMARAYEASGDAAAAAIIRKPIAAGPQMMRISSQKRLVEWYEPLDLTGQLVLEGATGIALERLAVELAQAHRFIEAGIDAPTRILFSGPSGTGKTTAARWLGGRLGMPVAVVRLTSTVEGFLGATGANLAKAVEEASGAPTILFLDEVDCLCARRDSGKGDTGSGEMARVTSSLLQTLDMMPPEQIVIAATNFLEKVDPALTRRLPTQVAFELPSYAARDSMIRGWWTKVPFCGLAVHAAVEATAGKSGADTRALAMELARAALLGDGTIR